MGAASHRGRRPAAAAALAVLVAALALLALHTAPARAADGEFRVTYSPPLDELVAQGNPDSPKTPTTITIQALGADGQPLRDAVVEARLTAPDPPPASGSDVPRIEGRELLVSHFGAPEGRYAFTYLLPIRGDYTLDLRARRAPGTGATFAPFGATETFPVGDRAVELQLFVLLLACLFLFGLISAILLARPKFKAAARRRTTGERAGPIDVPGVTGGLVALGLLLAVFVGFVVVDTVRETRSDRTVAGFQDAGRGAERAASNDSAALRYDVSRTSEDGIGVQTLVRTRGELTAADGGPPPPGATVRVESLDLETGKPMFATEAPPVDGRFELGVVYWDGVEYETTVAARGPGVGAGLSDTLEVAVDPMAPPISSKLVTMAWLLAPLVAGIGVGVLFARRRWGGSPGGSRPRVGAPSPGGAG